MREPSDPTLLEAVGATSAPLQGNADGSTIVDEPSTEDAAARVNAIYDAIEQLTGAGQQPHASVEPAASPAPLAFAAPGRRALRKPVGAPFFPSVPAGAASGLSELDPTPVCPLPAPPSSPSPWIQKPPGIGDCQLIDLPLPSPRPPDWGAPSIIIAADADRPAQSLGGEVDRAFAEAAGGIVDTPPALRRMAEHTPGALRDVSKDAPITSARPESQDVGRPTLPGTERYHEELFRRALPGDSERPLVASDPPPEWTRPPSSGTVRATGAEPDDPRKQTTPREQARTTQRPREPRNGTTILVVTMVLITILGVTGYVMWNNRLEKSSVQAASETPAPKAAEPAPDPWVTAPKFAARCPNPKQATPTRLGRYSPTQVTPSHFVNDGSVSKALHMECNPAHKTETKLGKNAEGYDVFNLKHCYICEPPGK